MRALVSIFAGLLILISLYQLSFTWFVNGHEKAMHERALREIKRAYPSASTKYPGDKEAQANYQDSVNELVDVRYHELLDSTKDTKITWWGQSYQKAKESELLLGLDLQGGINVTMDVSLDDLIKGLANNPKDPILQQSIQQASIDRQTNSDVNFIDLFAKDYKKISNGRPMAQQFANANRNKLSVTASDNAVINWLHDQADAAMTQSYDVLRNRIDRFGVAQPNINLDENKGIITIELAGATDAARVKKLLQSTANLQFWEVYTLNDADIKNGLLNADKALAQVLHNSKQGADSATLARDTSAHAVDSARLADSLALANQHPFTDIVHPAQPYPTDQGGYKYGGVLGVVKIQDTARANDYLANPIIRNNFPANGRFVWGKQNRDDNGKLLPYLDLYLIKTIPGKEGAELEGSVIEHAEQAFDPMSNQVLVNMSMNASGSRIWARMTEKNVGKPIAIVLDNLVYSAPNVEQKIEGGQSRITMGSGGGKNTQLVVQEAKDLANILEAGKLDAPAKIVADQVVGPTLGQKAVHGGMMAFGISFLVIFILMLIYYNTAGLVADIALILNLLFTIGVLSALGATLTAPGIAGLVLTIGMAVDTNVIIFERIKEELAKGNNYEHAVKIGYKRSLPPVLDAHVTTLLTAIILFIYGLGPVLGFATTQILGILLSLFCGILVSRLVTDFYTNKQRHFKYFTAISKRIFKHAKFKFIEYRKVAYGISVFVLIFGVGSFFHGFKRGVEFKGGRSYVVKFDRPVQEDKVNQSLEKAFGTAPTTKTYGDNYHLDILTDFMVNNESPATDSIVENRLFAGLKPFLPANLTASDFARKYIQENTKVGPTISDELKTGAKKAVVIGIITICIYIFIRFRDWRYSVGTIIALLHDVLVTLAVFSFLGPLVPFPLEIDQHFIAALLTVIGFSMNDTVIVFDRVREYSREMRGADKASIINKAVNDTLSRTVMTSLTVFLTILILFLVGGEVTRGFAFAMLIGVITGTYSSIFVAAPILVDFAKSKPLGEADMMHHHAADMKKKPAAPLAKKA